MWGVTGTGAAVATPHRRMVLRGLGLGLGLGLAGCAARAPEVPEPPPLPPLPDVRRIVLVHPQSNERLDTIYFHNGAYDPRAMEKTRQMLRDRNVGQSHPIDPLLLDFMFDLLYRTGLPPTTPVTVLSGFRSPETNARLIKDGRPAARESFHLQGKALDFRLDTLPGPAMAEIAKTMQRGGAAFYPRSNHTHIDTGPVRTWRTA